MKTCVMLAALLAAGSLGAQPPDKVSPPTGTEPNSQSSSSFAVSHPPKQNQPAAGHKVTYSGVAVEVARSKNQLQLFNPLTPMDPSQREGNLERDVITGKPTGAFKIFSIKF